MPRLEAAIRGAREVGFTVALDQPVADRGVRAADLLRRHRRAAVQRIRADADGRGADLAGRLADDDADDVRAHPAARSRTSGMAASIARRKRVFDAMLAFYRSTLRDRAAPSRRWCCCSLLATVGLNYYMFRYQMTYGLFPVQDTGLIIGAIQADQSISFQAMKEKFTQLQTIVQEDPAVDSVVGFTGGRQTNSGFIYSR